MSFQISEIENFEHFLLEQIEERIDLGGIEVISLPFLDTVLDKGGIQNSLVYWLAAQEQFPQFYVQSRDKSFELAGIGSAKKFETNNPLEAQKEFQKLIELLSTHPKSGLLNFVGGMKFNATEKATLEWNEFPAMSFVLPEIALVRRGEETRLLISLVVEKEEKQRHIAYRIAKILKKIKPSVDSIEGELPLTKNVVKTPEDWASYFKQAQAELSKGKIKKIVLAARHCVELESQHSPYLVLSQLQEKNSNSYAFFFAPSSKKSFTSITPERLFLLDGNYIQSDALAGTNSLNSHAGLSVDLQVNQKIIDEHQLVVDDLKNKFEKICTDFKVGSEKTVVQLNHLEHLLTKFSGTCKPELSISDILFLMIPTSAVSGNPPEAARQYLEEKEPFSRGWYSGPIGVISGEFADFAVALRCILASNNKLYFHAGAGILAESTAEQELSEIEQKILTTSQLFFNNL
jgi:menaquinone-specific isochorismate synthase